MARKKRDPKKVALAKANIVNLYFAKRTCGQKSWT